jgi:hypothetical protein
MESNGKRVLRLLASRPAVTPGPEGSRDWLVLHRTLCEHSVFTQGRGLGRRFVHRSMGR